jgi:hypothetical protein
VWPANLGSFRPGDLLDVELGLYLLQDVTPTRTAADVWPLLGGYPYSEVFGDVRSDEQRLRVLRARHYLWDMRRRHAWSEALIDYLKVPQHLRGYDIDGPGSVPRRREPSRAARRFEIFEELLSTAPRFATRSIPFAEEGEHTFRVQDRTHSVVFDEELLTDTLPRAHALDAPPAGLGEPIDVTWEELEKAAGEMDAVEATVPEGPHNGWAGRLRRVKLLVRDTELGRFTQQGRLGSTGCCTSWEWWEPASPPSATS